MFLVELNGKRWKERHSAMVLAPDSPQSFVKRFYFCSAPACSLVLFLKKSV